MIYLMEEEGRRGEGGGGREEGGGRRGEGGGGREEGERGGGGC